VAKRQNKAAQQSGKTKQRKGKLAMKAYRKAFCDQGIWWGRLAGLSVLLHMFIEAVGRKSVMEMVRYLVQRPVIFGINTLIILLPFTLIFLTRRKYFVTAVVAVIWAVAGIVNGFLLTFRTTPFTAADLRLVKYAWNMLPDYMSVFQMILAAIGIVLAVLACIWCYRKAPVDQKKVSWPLGLLTVAVSAGVVWGSARGAMETGILAVRFGNIGQAFKDYGFPYCFSNSLLNTGIAKPKTYDSETVEMIEKELFTEETYQLGGEKRPNIIMLQLESFFDPLQYRNYYFEKDPIPFFRYLKNHYPSGYLNVPSVGAGTANTEFECITGMNLDFFGPGEYPYKTVLQKTACESMAFDMKNLGYGAHAIHNNEGTFYDRYKVFSQLGFDTFTPIEYMYDVERNPTGWCRDEILVGEIVKTLDSTQTPDFVYTISVQGHGAYPDFEYYCEQIGEMDEFIRELVYTLNQRQEPTVLVMYGDHLPGFSWTAADMKNFSLFQTQYVVWNNFNLPKTHRTVESYQLAAWVLEMLDIHEGTMMRYHQGYLTGQAADKNRYLEDMEVLEYDILYGKQEIYEEDSPYESTDLQMGIMPVKVTDIVYKEPNLLIFGENFNEYSTVCLEEKQLDTMYVWPELIIVKDMDKKKYEKAKETLAVRQVGRDRIELGDAVMP